MSISFSASIGGSGSLVGTTPNLLLKAFYDEYYPSADLNFLSYMVYGLPAAAIMIIISWIVMSFMWLPRKLSSQNLLKTECFCLA